MPIPSAGILLRPAPASRDFGGQVLLRQDNVKRTEIYMINFID